MLKPNESIAQIVLANSACAAVFTRHHIDYCCHGDQTLEDACKSKGLEISSILRELDAAIAERSGSEGADPRTLSTPALIAHIISKHHEPLRRALALVGPLSSKVMRVHGQHNPKLNELNAAVQELAESLIPHLEMEEQDLFPSLMAKSPAISEVGPKLEGMHEEHLEVSRLLERIQEASDQYVVPEWGCNSYRTLFSELAEVEADLLRHVHLENHVLKPRFAQA